MSYETIRLDTIETDGVQIAILTLNRPERRNAIDHQMIKDLGNALEVLDADSKVRVVILTGTGDKAFAAGADIAELKQRDYTAALQRINSALFRRVEEHRLPFVAAIHGYALGGGCELAMACDIRVASTSAKLGQPEVGLGILPGAGAIQRLPRLVGMGRAKDLIYTGRIIDAEEAERIGLVQYVVADEQLMDKAKEVAKQIAKQGELAVQLSKQALNAAWGPPRAFDTLDALAQAVCFESADKHERMQNFLDKRSARQKAKAEAQS
jgi:enoyl-CoA hydratase